MIQKCSSDENAQSITSHTNALSPDCVADEDEDDSWLREADIPIDTGEVTVDEEGLVSNADKVLITKAIVSSSNKIDSDGSTKVKTQSSAVYRY